MTTAYACELVSKHWPDMDRAVIAGRLAYSTFVNFERRYLYYEVPKAGCTSIKTFIHEYEHLPAIEPLGGPPEVRRDMFIHDRRQFKLRSLMDFSNDQQEEILHSPSFFRFTVVRNPYTRVESAWRDKVRLCAPGYEQMYFSIKGSLPRAKDPQSLISFREFLAAIRREDLCFANAHWRLQHAHLFMPAIDFSHIGRLEAIEATKEAFVCAVGGRQLRLPAMNRTQRTDAYDEETAAIVQDLYAGDFAALHYAAEDWPRPSTGHQTGCVPEQRFLDEVLERNIILGGLYRARNALLELRSIKGAGIANRYACEEPDALFDKYVSPVEGWLSKAEAIQLMHLARTVSEGAIVEIGSYRGRSSVALALGSICGHSAPVYCIDPHEPFVGAHGGQFGPIDRGYFMRTIVELGLFHIVRLVNLGGEAVAGNWTQKVSLLWIDGDHRYDAVARDFSSWRSKLAKGAAVIFDDACDPRSGPGRLVGELVASGDFQWESQIGKTVRVRVGTAAACDTDLR